MAAKGLDTRPAWALEEMNDPTGKGSNTGQVPQRGKSFVLRFISGKYQGGEFPVTPGKEIIVGRSSDLDMVLVEDMVSRKHARINLQPDGIWIEDLGSTNGTFVNGEKIKRARLKEGDRILIGTSILKVIAGDGAPESTTGDAKRDLENVAQQRRTSQARTMSGAIEEIPLPDLLQLLSTSKKNGVLVIRTDDDVGKIYMRKGNIYHALINDLEEVPPLKALYRMLTWQRGLFDLDPPDDRSFPNEIDVTVAEVLMEGMRQLDEFERLRSELPDLNARLSIVSPLIPPLRELKPEELDVLQLAHNYAHVETVLNKSLAPDLETVSILLKLLKSSYLRSD
jgi:pSer/pThr/pTyr-binding forkhead associated (FHA) protein